MTAGDLIRLLTQAPFVLIFLIVALEAARRPYRANLDIALFFGALAAAVVAQWIAEVAGLELPHAVNVLVRGAVMALPYLLLRLVDDFATVPRWLLRAAEAGLVASLVVVVVFEELPAAAVIFLAGYFVAFQVYAGVKFVRHALATRSVPRRRMQAAAAGSLFLALTIAVAGLRAAFPGPDEAWTAASRLTGLASALSYLLAFAPPRFLLDAWQAPELRSLLARTADLPRASSVDEVVRELERGVSSAMGLPHAAIALWDEGSATLGNPSLSEQPFAHRFHPGEYIGGRAFEQQRAIFVADVEREDPEHAEMYGEMGLRAAISAPITAGNDRLGVLSVYAPRAPLFARDDTALVQLLAEHAAVILESRKLIEEAASVRALEETTRLKDDFLSAAAHDLKTPLTSIIAEAQLLERRAVVRPAAPLDTDAVRRIVRESDRLRGLVTELLDAARGDEGVLLGNHERVDLSALVRDASAQVTSGIHSWSVSTDDRVEVMGDRRRLAQLLANLLENAVKYSPDGGEVAVSARRDGREAVVAVSDSGIGIPPADLPHIFDRFRRGHNVDDRAFAGMGLGLFICRRVAEQHGGRIWAESRPADGSTFYVALPLAPEEAAP